MTIQGSGGAEGPPQSEDSQPSQFDRIVAAVGANEQVEMVGGFRFDTTDDKAKTVRPQRVIHIIPKFRDMPMTTPEQIATTVRELNDSAAALARRLIHELPDIGQPQIKEADGTNLAERGLRVATLTFTEGQDTSDQAPRGEFSELLPPQLVIAIFPTRELADYGLKVVANQNQVFDTIPPAFLLQQ